MLKKLKNNKILKVTGKVFEWLLFAVIVAVFIVVVSPLLPFKNVPKIFVVSSGSMVPTLEPGSVSFVLPQDEKKVKVGDVIAFKSPEDASLTIIHRIVGVKSEDPLIYETKGDANDSPDTWDLQPDEIVGKSLFSVPWVGILIAFIKKPLGFGLVIGIPAFLFLIIQIRNIKIGIDEEVDRRVAKIKQSEKTKDNSTIVSLILVVAAFASVVSTSSIHTATALFMDKANINGLSISVKDFVPPETPKVISPQDGSLFNEKTVKIKWETVSDYKDMNNPVYYKYQRSPKEAFSDDVYRSGEFSNNSFTDTVSGDGKYWWRVQACDALDNCSDFSKPWKFIVDASDPDSKIIDPKNKDRDNQTFDIFLWDGKLKGTASDDLSGIDYVVLSIKRVEAGKYWDGDSWVEGDEKDVRVKADGTANWSYDLGDGLQFGLFRVTSHAVDKAGNIEDSYTVEFENKDKPSDSAPQAQLEVAEPEIAGPVDTVACDPLLDSACEDAAAEPGEVIDDVDSSDLQQNQDQNSTESSSDGDSSQATYSDTEEF